MITEDGDLNHEIKRGLLLCRNLGFLVATRTNQDRILKSRDIPLPPKVCPVIATVFPVVTYGCESWTIKKAEGQSIEKITIQRNRVWTLVLEKTLESPLDGKGIWPVHPKGNQSWIFIGRSDADTDTPILRPPDAKNWLPGKDPDAEKD